MTVVNNTTTDEALQHSVRQLHDLITPKGFTASSERQDNYYRIWARDAVVCGLAALAVDDDALIDTFRTTLEALRTSQDKTGKIAMNIDVDSDDLTYGETVGRIDPTIWYIVGVTQLILHTGERELLDTYGASLDHALHFLRCIELNDRGLVYVPHGGDWADEYINHGYVLFDEVLYLLALDGHARVTESEESGKRAEQLRRLIKVNYFPGWHASDDPDVYNSVVFETARQRWKPPIPMAYFNNYTFGQHVDMLGTTLLLHTEGILTDEQHETVSETIISRYLSGQNPILPSFDPPVTEAEPCAWQSLQLNYRYRFKNKPHEYHNGGLWPLISGFFLSTKHNNGDLLERFADILARDEYLFPEFYNGETLEPGGTPHHAFTAAAYTLAHQNTIDGRPVFV